MLSMHSSLSLLLPMLSLLAKKKSAHTGDSVSRDMFMDLKTQLVRFIYGMASLSFVSSFSSSSSSTLAKNKPPHVRWWLPMGHASDEDNPTHHYATPLQACVRLASLPSEVTVLCWLKTICLHCGPAPNGTSIWKKKISLLLVYLSDRACWLKKNCPCCRSVCPGEQKKTNELDCVD
ncbi:hypothetical protein ASPCAL11464 [Aspergillus calidoustus]|uniref:Secreted protein n=1 Tax=Aspergillus calidoustus TaxID=454130 RepID=A0A0U5CEL1_ASPCI|nr:hypothetical protein ASPCAL11464 [Aspergillus calidoustus]